MSRICLLAISCIGVVFGLFPSGCREERVTARRPPARDAQAGPGKGAAASLAAPRLAPATAAERAYDRERRALLLEVVGLVEGAFKELRELARKGAADPAFREAWPAERAKFLAKVGRARTRVLEVDALGRQSYGARVASRLLGLLEVQLPNAVEESWSTRPGGALRTWSADFGLICSELRRYVLALMDEPRKGTSQ
ncbi:MAG: hypothetical protein RBU30_06070 [Polyangia bacterium]|jgi:hypothetical protein|nr:hypothetical protein [Polyangia bacterium]